MSTLGEPVTEVSHSVTLSVGEGLATFVVRRTFANTGVLHDEAVLSVDMPTFAIATGLRIRAGNVWYGGDLLEAQEAADKYTELTGMGGFQARDPALLAWESEATLHLRIFPVPPGATATLEYTLVAPLGWEGGEAIVDYWRGGEDEALSTVVLQVLEYPGQILVDGRLVTFEQPVVLSARGEGEQDSGTAQIRLKPDQSKIIGRAGSTEQIRLTSEGSTVFSKIEFDLPQRLSELPKLASVVFLMDRSRSVSEELVQAQLDVMEGVASFLPDARFEIVMVDRQATPLQGALVDHAAFVEALARLRDQNVALKNGSNLDLGLAMGRDLLKDVQGPRFIIALSDDRLRPSWDTQAVARATGIMTHIVVLDHGFSRDDAHRLSSIALTEGGILVRTGGDGLRSEFEHLVRPIRLEGVSVSDIDDEIGDLDEGSAYRFFGVVPKRPRAALRAKLWNQPIVVNAWRRPAFDRAAAGWVFSHGLFHGLDEEDMMRLARYAEAVSPVTSYLAIEPGVRPSVVGIDRSASGLGMQGFGAGGYGMGIGIGTGPVPKIEIDVEPCRLSHPGQQAKVTVHTTTIEIVDVVAHSSNEFTACIVERAWATELPSAFLSFAQQSQALQF
ncbi:MAG: VWA domain-containing protein [Bradymonadaceae bacterium]|nr:VWA domain-containing protein [Lujinxingiaceae bacterium]